MLYDLRGINATMKQRGSSTRCPCSYYDFSRLCIIIINLKNWYFSHFHSSTGLWELSIVLHCGQSLCQSYLVHPTGRTDCRSNIGGLGCCLIYLLSLCISVPFSYLCSMSSWLLPANQLLYEE